MINIIQNADAGWKTAACEHRNPIIFVPDRVSECDYDEPADFSTDFILDEFLKFYERTDEEQPWS